MVANQSLSEATLGDHLLFLFQELYPNTHTHWHDIVCFL